MLACSVSGATRISDLYDIVLTDRMHASSAYSNNVSGGHRRDHRWISSVKATLL